MSTTSRALKLDTDGTITEVQVSLEFPQMNIDMFGEGRLIERVSPVGLAAWNASRPRNRWSIMIVDESGLYHPDYSRNVLASVLYGCLDHGNEIKGPAYLIDESHEAFMGLDEGLTVEIAESLVERFLPIEVARLASAILN